MKLSYLDLTTTDPSYNLAMEQYVFDCLPRDRMYFMLWQNDNAIIVGKYQNTLSEINLEAVERRGIRVVRRLSGGGAVYHDMGNLNFTFITDAASGTALDMNLFCQPVVRTLAALGVHAEVNGRNDITIDGKKFSGNSQYLRQGRVMHHGTIMFNSDLSVVSEALQVDPTKFQTKGVRSVRSRVTNVADHLDRPVSLPEFRRILLENILRENPGQPYPLTPKDLAAVAACGSKQASYEKMHFDQHDVFSSFYFIDRHLPLPRLKEVVNELFADASCGRIMRIKGFTSDGNGWLELNASRDAMTLKPIAKAQEVIIVIGEQLNRAAIEAHWKEV